MATQQKARKAYSFLLQHSSTNEPFTVAELMQAAGWSKQTVTTYLSKQYRDFIEQLPSKKLRVKPEFQRLSEAKFLQLVTQKRKVFSQYQRFNYSEIVVYEFLLPLTREDQLRRALDELFYEDTVRQRLAEIGLERTAEQIPRMGEEGDEDYVKRICELVSQKFGGYSISHVSGRYRAAELASREQAALMLRDSQRYIIDETTASVRLIIPLESTKSSEGGNTDEVSGDAAEKSSAIVDEITLIRFLFFELFVEAIVRMVEGEDVIWLIEEAASSRTLYVWERA